MHSAASLPERPSADVERLRFALRRLSEKDASRLLFELTGERHKFGAVEAIEALTDHLGLVVSDIRTAADEVDRHRDVDNALEKIEHIEWWLVVAKVILALRLGPLSPLEVMASATCAETECQGSGERDRGT